MTTTRRRRRPGSGPLRHPSLGLTVAGILIIWLVLYVRGDPSTHLGAFYGNALADWLGTFVLVIATKFLYEIGSPESRTPHPTSRSAFLCFCVEHSLTIGLVVTGVMWAVFYARIDANGKTGQVGGDNVSERTQ